MRKIKFRAWDKRNNEWRKPSEWYIDPKGRIGIYWLPNNKTCFDSDLIICQFTGLEDKNGKEIYEGDIVQSQPTPHLTVTNLIGVVRYLSNLHTYTATFAIEWINSAGGYDFYSPHFAPKSDRLRPFEVIGNIYENPDLLPSA